MASCPPWGWRQSRAAQMALSMLLLHAHRGLASSAEWTLNCALHHVGLQHRRAERKGLGRGTGLLRQKLVAQRGYFACKKRPLLSALARPMRLCAARVCTVACSVTWNRLGWVLVVWGRGKKETGSNRLLQGPYTVATKGGRAAFADQLQASRCWHWSASQAHPWVDAGQSFVPWLGVILGWQRWSEGRVEVGEVLLGVPAMAMPCLTHRGMPHGVTAADRSTAWDFGGCGELGEGWVLLAIPSRPPWWNPGWVIKELGSRYRQVCIVAPGTMKDIDNLGNEHIQLLH